MTDFYEIVQGINDIFSLFVPGALLIYTFDFFTTKKITNEKLTLIRCIVYSFIIRSFYITIHNTKCLSLIEISIGAKDLILACSGIICGVFGALAYEKRWFDQFGIKGEP